MRAREPDYEGFVERDGVRVGYEVSGAGEGFVGEAVGLALDGVCTIWQANGGERKIATADFVTGDQRNMLERGDLLRQIDIPLATLRRRSAFRQISLTPVGRSAALLIGTLDDEGFVLTVTASTVRPLRLSYFQ